MASGTLYNLAESAFVRTPPTVAARIMNLLAQRLPTGIATLPDALASGTAPITVLDPTCGEGDLLEPFRYPAARLYGVEISAERASQARKRMPHASIVTTAFEATRITPGSMSLVLANPPYMVTNGVRLEYAIIRDAGKSLMPGGIMVAIVPARQWDHTMVNHWSRNYRDIRAWRFRDGESEDDEEAFATFTQIVVAGVRRDAELAQPDPAIKAQIALWRWRIPDLPGASPWAGGHELPVLPDMPISNPFLVPACGEPLPEITVVKAGDAQLLLALESSGAHLSPAWAQATQWQAHSRIEAPVLPPTGTAHLAADILTGLLDGDIVTGPDGLPYIFNTFVTSEMAPVEVDEDQKGKGVVRILQQQDKAVLTVLALTSGTITTYTGADAFAFLRPWLPTLAVQVRTRRQPLYDLNARDWEIAEMAEVGLDKTLPDAEHAGLAPAQIHRSIAMLRALNTHRKVAIQGEMGTGKTRMLTGLIRLFAREWACRPAVYAAALQPHHDRISACRAEIAQRIHNNPDADLSDLQHILHDLLAARQAVAASFGRESGEQAPRWLKQLRRAWQSNHHLKRLGITGTSRALPVAVACPRRVISVWESEISQAYPGCETLVIESHRDVRRWLERCTVSEAPAVVALFPQSLTRPGRVIWQPAVIEKQRTRESAVTNAAKACHAEWDTERGRWVHPQPLADGSYDETLPVRDVTELKHRDEIIGYCDTATGRTITEPIVQSHFFCPDCGSLIEGQSRGTKKALRADTDAEQAKAAEEETLEPVTSITYFVKQQRICPHCQAPLWTRVWTPATQAKAGIPSFACWSRAAEAVSEQAAARQAIAEADTRKKRRTARQPVRMATIPADAPTEQVIPGVTLAGPIEDSFSPYQYLLRFFRGLVALAIVDESHNARGKDTDIAAAIHELQRASQCYVFASGTHYGGAISDFYHYWFRFDPGFWPKLGLGWNNSDQAVSLYGVVQEVTKEHESDARKGSGRADTTTTTIAAPGISARLLPHLLSKMVFISVLDVGAFMPPREEIPEVIDMADAELALRLEEAQATLHAAREHLKSAEQDEHAWRSDPAALIAELNTAAEAVRQAHAAQAEAQAALTAAEAYRDERDLGRTYSQIERTLEGMAQKRVSAAMLAKGTLPRLWAVQPFGPPISVTSTQRSDWGDVLGIETLFTTPHLSPDHLYPMERRLREIVGCEREEGRICMVYFFQNDERPMAPRLAQILADFNPWVLPNSVDPEDREDAIKTAVASGRSVLLVPYTRVIEGLNLQVIDTIIWWEMAMNLFHLDQASRRAWRLGKREKVRLYYLVYRNTVAHKKLHKLGSQSGAASLFAGDTPDGALARSTGADKTTLAQLSSGLAETGDLKAAFDRRGKELEAALRTGREWIGVVDTLPERLRAYRAAQTARTVTLPTIVIPADQEITSSEPALPAWPVDVLADGTAAPILELVGAHIPSEPRIQFGDLTRLAGVLRSRRKARRAAPVSSEHDQADMLALFESPPLPRAIYTPGMASATPLEQANLF